MTLNDQYNKWKETTLKKSLEKFRRGKSASRPRQASRSRVWRCLMMQSEDPALRRIYVEKLGFPGEYPYTRGVQPTMYRSRFWTMRQYAGFSTAEESNKRYRYLLEQGQTGLSVAFDLPTQIGYDADDPIAQGEVGKVGVSISSIHDMEQLFDQIPLDKVSTSMTINAPAGVLLAMYIAVAKRQGADMRQLRGTIQNDILKEYVARGTYIFPPAPSMRLITDIFSFCAKEVPYWNTISISGYHIREAGSTAVQEVAFTLANGIAYVEAALDGGLQRGRLRGSAFVLLQRAQQPARRGRQVPRRAPHVGEDHARTFQSAEAIQLAIAFPHADRRLHAHRAATRKQRGARHAPGSFRRARRDAIPAHQQHGRSPVAAHGEIRPRRAAHTADHRLRVGRGGFGRSAGGFVSDRTSDRRDRKRRARLHRQN